MLRLPRLFGSSNSPSARRSRHALATRQRLRAQLGVEPLEARRVLAAYINEFHFSPTFGDAEIHQYLEFRGEPGSTIAPGTYFIGVESAEGINDLGDVQTIINLSNQTFGSNGLLVLLPSGHGFSTDAAANVLVGTDGFAGLPNGMFRADGGSNIVRAGSSTYFLVQSETPPDLDDDIDLDDNGVPDGAHANWTIYDSFSILPFYESAWTQRSLGRIVFAEDGVGDSYLTGSTVIHSDLLGYVGRIGESVGFSGEDWLTGNTVEVGSSTWDFQLQHGVFGATRPFAYGGRMLDHIGGSNWYGSLTGSVFRDDNADGVQQPHELPIAGLDVLADFDGDGQTGFYWETIDADDYPLGTVLSNISSNVTIVSAGADNVHQGFKILASQEPLKPVGQNVFSHEGVTFFNENRRVRMDFYQPVRSVSIDVIGDSDLKPTYGRLEIFDKDDQSLGFVRTDALDADELQTLTLTRTEVDIAWALAYPEDSYLDSSPFGRLDNLRIEQREVSAVTNANGQFELRKLTKGAYPISVDDTVGYTQVFPVGGMDQEVQVAYNAVTGVNFGLQGTVAATLEDQNLQVGELLGVGGVIATLPIDIGYSTQELLINTLSGDPAGLFSVDPVSFELRLNRPELNFETTTSYTLELELVDAHNGALKDMATIQLEVLDENDAPQVAGNSATIAENSNDGLEVATMVATDEDAGAAGTVRWSIAGGNMGDAFRVDPESGLVTVNNSAALDFEQIPEFVLQMRATDGGSPANFGDGTLTVTLTDVNEAPTIPSQAFGVVENSPEGTEIGQLLLEEQDAGQTAQWSIVGGEGQALFQLDTDGKLSVAADAELDFETKSSYLLEVQAVDSGEPVEAGTGTVTINLVDINDAPQIASQSFTLDEDAGTGQVVGTVAGSDQDAGQQISFAISGGSHASSFDIDPASGELTVAEGASLDFETQAEVTVEITVSDNFPTPASSQALVTILLNDVNEAPEIVTNSVSIVENTPASSSLGAIEANDPDADDTLTFAILSQSPTWVALDSETGELTVAEGAEIDFEAQSENELVVRVSDASGLQTDKTIALLVTDANDPPVLVQPIADMETVVGALFSLTLPSDMFTDQDAEDTLQLSVTSADGFSLPGWLEYDAPSRTLSGTPAVSDVGAVDVRVAAVDSQGATSSDTFRITVVENSTSWHNASRPFDTSGDGFISPIDVLLVVNYLNSTNPSEIPENQPPEFGMLDVNDDGFVTPIDALLPTNYLNSGGAPEGEQATGHFADWSDILDLDDTEEEEVLSLLAADQHVDGL